MDCARISGLLGTSTMTGVTSTLGVIAPEISSNASVRRLMMSKRAEELARKLDCMTNRIDIDLDITKAAALIDAELRKERERCAERLTTRADELEKTYGIDALDIATCYRKAVAVLKEAEDEPRQERV
jgi:hypothetical protein